MTIRIELFIDLIDALGKVVDGLKAIVNLLTEGRNAVHRPEFQQHASDARSAGQDTKRTQSIRDGPAAFRTTLIAERQVLIKKDLAFYTLV